jgi:hypothetical protein
MVGRLRETIERSLGALLVARRIQSDPGSCPELAAVLHGWDGKFNILMRKRIARHIESCGACEDLRSRSVSPAALLGAPVFIPAPAWLKNSVERDFELTSASHGISTSSQAASTADQSNFHSANTAPRPAIQPPPDVPQQSYGAYEEPAALVGGPTEDESKRRVVPFMALLIAVPLVILGGTLAWVYLPSTALSPSGVVQDAPSPSPTPTVPAPTPAAVLPTPQPPKATPAPVPAQTPRASRPAAPLPTPQAKIPTPQPLAPIPTPQAPALAPPPVQVPAPAPVQIPQLPIGSLPAIIPGMPPAAQYPARPPAQLPAAQVPANPPAQAPAKIPAQAPPVDPAPKEVPAPVDPAPNPVPAPAPAPAPAPEPAPVPDPVGPAPKKVEPAPAPPVKDCNVELCVH